LFDLESEDRQLERWIGSEGFATLILSTPIDHDSIHGAHRPLQEAQLQLIPNAP